MSHPPQYLRKATVPGPGYRRASDLGWVDLPAIERAPDASGAPLPCRAGLVIDNGAIDLRVVVLGGFARRVGIVHHQVQIVGRVASAIRNDDGPRTVDIGLTASRTERIDVVLTEQIARVRPRVA